MYCWKWDMFWRLLLTSGIGVCSFLGDQELRNGRSALMRAVFDNLTHATVGGLTWALIVVLSRKSLVQNLSSVFLCFALSSLVDVDHFLAARSWKINDATHLQKRPFLHCTTVPLLTWSLFILSANAFDWPRLGQYAWMVLASFLSHHIRDGTRRGLWFCPFGSTQPIPYYMYLAGSMILPYLLHWLMAFSADTRRIHENISMADIV